MLATRDETWASELQPVLVTLWLQVFHSSRLPLHPVFAHQLRRVLPVSGDPSAPLKLLQGWTQGPSSPVGLPRAWDARASLCDCVVPRCEQSWQDMLSKVNLCHIHPLGPQAGCPLLTAPPPHTLLGSGHAFHRLVSSSPRAALGAWWCSWWGHQCLWFCHRSLGASFQVSSLPSLPLGRCVPTFM